MLWRGEQRDVPVCRAGQALPAGLALAEQRHITGAGRRSCPGAVSGFRTTVAASQGLLDTGVVVGPRGSGRIVLLVVLSASLAACTSHSAHGYGVVAGSAPVCYGPGPEANIAPTHTVSAAPSGGGSTISMTVVTNEAHHAYRMSLPAGAYKIGVPGDPSVEVTVRPGVTQTVDLPPENCL